MHSQQWPKTCGITLPPGSRDFYEDGIFPKSIQPVVELWIKNYSAIAFLVGKQVLREILAIFFTLSARWIGEHCRSLKGNYFLHKNTGKHVTPQSQFQSAIFLEKYSPGLPLFTKTITGLSVWFHYISVIDRRLPKKRLSRRYRLENTKGKGIKLSIVLNISCCCCRYPLLPYKPMSKDRRQMAMV